MILILKIYRSCHFVQSLKQQSVIFYVTKFSDNLLNSKHLFSLTDEKRVTALISFVEAEATKIGNILCSFRKKSQLRDS